MTNLKHDKPNKNHTKNIIMKLLKTGDKQLKKTYRGAKIRIINNLPSEIIESKRRKNNIFKILQEK